MKTRKNVMLKAIALTLGGTMGLGFLAACGGDEIPVYKDALVIMTEELNGLFNPFYSTAGTDMDVVGQTQIGMLSTDANGGLAYGDSEPTVVKDYEMKKEDVTGDGKPDSIYYFVIKNGIKFSDGTPLTMKDVMFNLYVYLDPAYTGSTTMYSTDIVGLQAYRTQSRTTDDNLDKDLTATSTQWAKNRADELINLYKDTGKQTGSTALSASPAQMREAIANHTPSAGYLQATGLENDIAAARDQLLADYNEIVGDPDGEDADAKDGLFRQELISDYNGAKSAYLEEPYKSAPVYNTNGEQIMTGFDEVVSFMFMEGFATPKYPQVAGQAPDKSKIERVDLDYPATITTQQAAIDYVHTFIVQSEFDVIMQAYATGTTVRTQYAAKARDVLLHENLEGDQLVVPSIDGIKSLGHNTELTKVEINGKTYEIAQEHKDDGTPVNDSQYDVLRIEVNGVDPKAKWNFSFTVAPYHYYSDVAKYPVNIEENKFGVKWASYDFQKGVIQGKNTWGQSKNKVPLGAGPYVATDNGGETARPGANAFLSNNVVYYKSNANFLLGEPKIKKMQYHVVSSANALGVLQSGEVHFVEPQFTKANQERLDGELKSVGIKSLSTWQLGYGYIGINAGYVQNVNLRRAIMSAMNTSLSLDYYVAQTATTIAWPMSLVSWAYPRTEGHTYDGSRPLAYKDDVNGKSYMMYTTEAAAKEKILGYMADAGAEEGDPRLKLKFTIAGSNMTEHPVYAVFLNAMKILNDCGWNIEIAPDTNALIKLSTGSLAVWAAAWGSTIDPDMYQVYHKNSTATSTLAWGYDDILADTGTYAYENGILNQLATYITDARETDVEAERIPLYKQAMSLVLDLAVEMPVYQRQTLYAYNSNVIKESTFPHDENGELIINSYSSPLSRIWELEFAD